MALVGFLYGLKRDSHKESVYAGGLHTGQPQSGSHDSLSMICCSLKQGLSGRRPHNGIGVCLVYVYLLALKSGNAS